LRNNGRALRPRNVKNHLQGKLPNKKIKT
jgi:hypothetical protein